LTEFPDCTLEKKAWVSVREVHVPRLSGFEEYEPAAAFKLVKKVTGLKRLTLTFNAERLRLVVPGQRVQQHVVRATSVSVSYLLPTLE
jgi:hypothetical protein